MIRTIRTCLFPVPFSTSPHGNEKNLQSYQPKYFTAKVVTLTVQRIIYSQHSVSLLNFLKVSLKGSNSLKNRLLRPVILLASLTNMHGFKKARNAFNKRKVIILAKL